MFLPGRITFSAVIYGQKLSQSQSSQSVKPSWSLSIPSEQVSLVFSYSDVELPPESQPIRAPVVIKLSMDTMIAVKRKILFTLTFLTSVQKYYFHYITNQYNG